MKEQDAIYILQRLEFACQRCRTMALEENHIEDEFSSEGWILRDLFPWLFGENSMLIPLVRLNERIRKGQVLEASDFLNFMFLVDKTALLKYYGVRDGDSIRNFPEPDISIIKNWEAMVRDD